MSFVFTTWYIIAALLVLAIVGAVVAFILMDKQDKVIINDFVKSNQPDNQEEPAAKSESEPTQDKTNE